MILPAVEHEIGNIGAAAYFGAVTVRIGLCPITEEAAMGGFSGVRSLAPVSLANRNVSRR